MALPELLVLLKQCVAANDQSEALLMAYLDRVHEGWREQAGTAGGASSNAAGGMSRAEAFDVLGLDEGASEAAIRKAYRELMKKHHPDQGARRGLLRASMKPATCCWTTERPEMKRPAG
jgi:DnaJ-domain-containing protein 1